MADPDNSEAKLQAVARQVLMLGNSVLKTQSLARQVLLTLNPTASEAKVQAVARQVLTIAPTNTPDYNVRMEVLAAGYIHNNVYAPYGANDFGVVMEVLAASTFTPAHPMTAIHWFTPS
jgi:hypothetical protein